MHQVSLHLNNFLVRAENNTLLGEIFSIWRQHSIRKINSGICAPLWITLVEWKNTRIPPGECWNVPKHNPRTNSVFQLCWSLLQDLGSTQASTYGQIPPSFNISQKSKTVHGEVKTWRMRMQIKHFIHCLFSPPAITLLPSHKIKITFPLVLHTWGIRAKRSGDVSNIIERSTNQPVSYTHLTLPTKRIV